MSIHVERSIDPDGVSVVILTCDTDAGHDIIPTLDEFRALLWDVRRGALDHLFANVDAWKRA